MRHICVINRSKTVFFLVVVFTSDCYYVTPAAASFVTCQLVIHSFCNAARLARGYVVEYLSVFMTQTVTNEFYMIVINNLYIYCVEK